MNQILTLFIVCLSLSIGSILGYFARQSIARKQIGSIEEKLRRKIEKTQKEIEEMMEKAREKSLMILKKAKK